MTIVAHGQVFTAHQCRICGAKDANAISLAAHEQRHEVTSAALAGKLKSVKFGRKSWNLKIKICREDGCELRARSRSYCMKHYMRRKMKGGLVRDTLGQGME